jgi:hypothetical protein
MVAQMVKEFRTDKAAHDPRELIAQLRGAATPGSDDDLLIDWTGAEGLFARSADVIERLVTALNDLLPGLVLDLRYAEPDDDKEAMQSRITTVTEALTKGTSG